MQCCTGDTLLHEAVNMSSKVGLVKPNDHVVVVQMISDSLVVKASPSHDLLRLHQRASSLKQRSLCGQRRMIPCPAMLMHVEGIPFVLREVPRGTPVRAPRE